MERKSEVEEEKEGKKIRRRHRKRILKNKKRGKKKGDKGKEGRRRRKKLSVRRIRVTQTEITLTKGRLGFVYYTRPMFNPPENEPVYGVVIFSFIHGLRTEEETENIHG